METIQKKAEEGITSEMALVQAAKKGDLEAFSELVKRYDRNVFRIAQHITHNEEDAQDVVQDAFLKAYQNLEQFQGNSKFYTWLVRIAVNEALMRLRKRVMTGLSRSMKMLRQKMDPSRGKSRIGALTRNSFMEPQS